MAVKFSVGVGDDKSDRRLSAARKKVPKPARGRRSRRENTRPPGWPVSQPPAEDDDADASAEPPPEWAW